MNFDNLKYEENANTVATKLDDFRGDFIYGMSTMQGYRRSQEDQATYHPYYYKDFSYFAVFDGHNGAEVAVYLKENLHIFLRKFLETEQPVNALHLAFTMVDMHLRTYAGLSELQLIKSKLEPISEGISNPADSVCRDIFAMFYKQGQISSMSDDKTNAAPSENSDELMRSTQKNFDDFVKKLLRDKLEPADSKEIESDDSSSEKDKEGLDSSEMEQDQETTANSTQMEAACSEPLIKSNHQMNQEQEKLNPGIFSGSTATVILFSLDQIFVANVGDSRCIISSNKDACEMSEDHEPTLKQEKKRIIKAGHVVQDERIDGILSLSRTIGDFFLKKQGLPLHEQAVIPVPHIKEMKCDNTLDFLVVASDGIWISFENEEVVEFIVKRLAEQHPPRLSGICEELSLECISKKDPETGDGMDNITMAVIVPRSSCYFKKLPRLIDPFVESEESYNLTTKRMRLRSRNIDGDDD